MPFALTVDQIDSRHDTDRVDRAVHELQGLLTDPVSVVDAILMLMRNEHWHIGLGIGPVEEPLPAETRSARGAAFLSARAAVERAKADPSHVAVVASADPEHFAADAEAGFRLLAAVRSRRTDQGWQAIDQMNRSRSQQEAAAALGVSRQAISQRLQAAQWSAEAIAVPLLTRLLQRADAAAT